nr:uncharacterized protein LOC109192553 [Ipomoea batatas]
MIGVRRMVHGFWRQVHTKTREGPSENLKKKVAEIETKRKSKSPWKTQVFIQVPDSMEWLDTPTMPMIIIAVGTAVVAKLLMTYDDSKSQETIEEKIKNAPEGQGTVRMLTREEWDAIQEMRPRTPFESKLARPNARIRTGDPIHLEDVKDWSVDVLSDALTRAEEFNASAILKLLSCGLKFNITKRGLTHYSSSKELRLEEACTAGTGGRRRRPEYIVVPTKNRTYHFRVVMSLNTQNGANAESRTKSIDIAWICEQTEEKELKEFCTQKGMGLIENVQKPVIDFKIEVGTIGLVSLHENMIGVRRMVHGFWRQVHTKTREGPSENLKKKVAEIETKRKSKSPRKTQVFIQVPDSMEWLDTPTMPMIIIAVGTAVVAKLLMTYDDSKSQETIEEKIKNAPEGQGTVRMLTREEWDAIQEMRPRTPFESKLARPNARIRTGDPIHLEDVRDWSVDVLSDALTRAEEFNASAILKLLSCGLKFNITKRGLTHYSSSKELRLEEACTAGTGGRRRRPEYIVVPTKNRTYHFRVVMSLNTQNGANAESRTKSIDIAWICEQTEEKELKEFCTQKGMGLIENVQKPVIDFKSQNLQICSV